MGGFFFPRFWGGFFSPSYYNGNGYVCVYLSVFILVLMKIGGKTGRDSTSQNRKYKKAVIFQIQIKVRVIAGSTLLFLVKLKNRGQIDLACSGI